MSFSFVSLDEASWRIIKAAESSLTVSELALKAGIELWEASRLLKRIKSTSIGVRLGFEANLRKAGLLEVATITRKPKEVLPYLQAERILRVLGSKLFLYTGLLPAEESAMEEWLASFEDSAVTVKALERKWWRTDAPATAYRDGVVYGEVGAVKVTERSPPSFPKAEVELDDVDVLLLWAKMRWPFTSLREIERESEKYLGRRVPHQVLSRHFKKHLLRLWAGNRVWLYADAQQIPYKLLYLEGRDAPAVARALVQLPWFHTAYIDVDRAIVSGQPPCASMPKLYEVLGDLDVEVAEFAMEVSMRKWVPIFNLLGQFVKRREVVADEV